MKAHLLLLSGLDTMLVLLVTLVLALGAATYDKSRGIGDKGFMPIDIFRERFKTNEGEEFSNTFVAILLDENSAEIFNYRSGKAKKIGELAYDKLSIEAVEGFVDKDIPVVIYDPDSSIYLGSFVRFLTDSGASFGVVVNE